MFKDNSKNNEIKDIVKVIRMLENRWIYLKGTTHKVIGQEGGFLSTVRSLMTTSLSLIKIYSRH